MSIFDTNSILQDYMLQSDRRRKRGIFAEDETESNTVEDLYDDSDSNNNSNQLFNENTTNSNLIVLGDNDESSEFKEIDNIIASNEEQVETGNEAGGDSGILKYLYTGAPFSTGTWDWLKHKAGNVFNPFHIKHAPKIATKLKPAWPLMVADAVDYGVFPIYDYLPKGDIPDWRFRDAFGDINIGGTNLTNWGLQDLFGETTSDLLSWRGPGKESLLYGWLKHNADKFSTGSAPDGPRFNTRLYDRDNPPLDESGAPRDPNTDEYEIIHGRPYQH